MEKVKIKVLFIISINQRKILVDEVSTLKWLLIYHCCWVQIMIEVQHSRLKSKFNLRWKLWFIKH